MLEQNSTPEFAFRVLVVVSRPLDLKELPNVADQWALLNGLATVKTPAYLHILRPPTIERLRTEILNRYDIIHFDGHGSFAICCPNCAELNNPADNKCERCKASLEGVQPRAYLVFEQEDGKQDSLGTEEFAEMLRNVPGMPTKLIFLSACESATDDDNSLAAALLKEGIPAMLAMTEIVSIEVTTALSRSFYAGIGAGMTISQAFKSSLSALSRFPDNTETGTKAKDIPILLGEGIEERLVDAPVRGSIIMERETIFGVPDLDFLGEVIPYNPPLGRKGLLMQIFQALLRGEKLIVLVGQGGIGKSVLASVVARRIAWFFPGGVFWRSAQEIENFGLNELLDAFVSIFGYEFRTWNLDTKRDVVLNYLRDLQTPSLIVLDNAENVIDSALWRFLEGLPRRSSALIATREALTREGLHIDVPKMEYEEAIGLFKEKDGYYENEKAGLFISAARRATNNYRWGKRLNGNDMNALKEIDKLLEGHPLGIKLAAALVSRQISNVG